MSSLRVLRLLSRAMRTLNHLVTDKFVQCTTFKPPG